MARPLRPFACLLALAALASHAPAASAACVRAGNPQAQEVEILACIDPRDYFEAHFLELHPQSLEPGRFSPDTPRQVFAGQLGSQPGTVLRVRVLRRREYSEPDEPAWRYRWEGRWRRERPVEETFLYLRRAIPGCDGVEVGAKAAFILYPQCCDTGYLGEIGCHLDLVMVQDLPDELRPASVRATLKAG